MAIWILLLLYTNAWNNGLGHTPQMGWNSWNHFGCSVSDQRVRETADAFIQYGLALLGYVYINIDDCWSDHNRNSNGSLVSDSTKFPYGMKNLSDYVHSLGLKLGIYSDAGTLTCAKYPGSLGHEL